MTYSIFGPSPILATDALLVGFSVVVVVVLPPMTTAGGLWNTHDEQIEFLNLSILPGLHVFLKMSKRRMMLMRIKMVMRMMMRTMMVVVMVMMMKIVMVMTMMMMMMTTMMMMRQRPARAEQVLFCRSSSIIVGG